jgi:hypothetical protein
MKKRRSTKPNHRPKPKKNKSPWHKFRAVPEKPAAPVSDEPENDYYTEMESGETVTEIETADEIEELENDVDAEPPEESE